jgi:hypothetical protein
MSDALDVGASPMIESAIAHARDAITNATLRTDPFEHVYVEDVFPANFYEVMQRQLPANESYARLSDSGLVSPHYPAQRYFLETNALEEAKLPAQERMFWSAFLAHLHDESFVNGVMAKFANCINARFADELNDASTHLERTTRSLFIRDFGQYALGPHTDNPQKLVAMLFYLPEVGSESALGTSLYAPKDPTFKCHGLGAHYDFDMFDRVDTKPFKPNSLFAFPKTMDCWHGVELVPDDSMRNLLLLDIRRP